MRTSLLLALLLPAAACGDDAAGGDDTTEHDADPGAIDGPAADGPSPDAPSGACGTAQPPLAQISGTEGIAIAPDGTIYYSQSGAVGRWVPGEADADDSWVALTGPTTVWGMGLAGDTLYVATPATGDAGIIWQIDTSAASPSATMLYPNAGRPNGLTVGPDGAVYYGDFKGGGGGHVYRVDSSGNRTTVTDTTFVQPNGVLFDDDGTLLVALYGAGEIWRVTLDDAHSETARVRVGVDAGSPDGIARDAQGR